MIILIIFGLAKIGEKTSKLLVEGLLSGPAEDPMLLF